MPFDAGFYQARKVLFDTDSANSSTFTSGTHWTGDYRQISVDISAALNSGMSIEGSNDDGFRAAVTNWSTLTRITAAGIYAVDPGFRWMRGRRQSADSRADLVLQGRS